MTSFIPILIVKNSIIIKIHLINPQQYDFYSLGAQGPPFSYCQNFGLNIIMQYWKRSAVVSVTILCILVTNLVTNFIYLSSYQGEVVRKNNGIEKIFNHTTFNSLPAAEAVLNTYLLDWVIVDSIGKILAQSPNSKVSSSYEIEHSYNKIRLEIYTDRPIWNGGQASAVEEFSLYYKTENYLVGVLPMALAFCVYVLVVAGAIVFGNTFFNNLMEKNRNLSQANRRLEFDKSSLSKLIRKQRQGRSLFVADLCHEIRTPLHALVSNISLVADKEKLKEYGHRIKKTETLLLDYLDDFINIAKSEENSYPMKLEKVMILTIIEDAIDVVRARNANVKDVAITIPDKSLMCLTDPLRVRQILINLITNAMKYGSDIVHIDCSISHDGKPLLSVRDYGKGIQPEVRKKIFNAFDRANRNESDEYEGIGLGLHIVSNICKAMNADISVTGALPNGSIFSVKLDSKIFDLVPAKPEVNSIKIAAIFDLSLGNSAIMLSMLQDFGNYANIDTYISSDDLADAYHETAPFHDIIIGYEINERTAELIQALAPNIPCIDLAYEKTVNNQDRVTINTRLRALNRSTIDLIPKSKCMGRVLIVDDNLRNMAPISKIFSKHHSVFMLDNIFDAMIAIRSQKFDLIFIDLKLHYPEQGYELICRCRISGANKRTPIYAYTASSVRSLIDLCLISGADSVLQKPIRFDLDADSLLNVRRLKIKPCSVTDTDQDLLYLTGKAFDEDRDRINHLINNHLGRQDEGERTVVDEVFEYFLTLKREPLSIKIVDYMMNRLRKECGIVGTQYFE